MTKKEKNCLCDSCQSFFNEICLKINAQTEKMKRGNMIKDALCDVMRSIEDGNINAIIERDKNYKSGKSKQRRLKTKILS